MTLQAALFILVALGGLALGAGLGWIVRRRPLLARSLAAETRQQERERRTIGKSSVATDDRN